MIYYCYIANDGEIKDIYNILEYARDGDDMRVIKSKLIYKGPPALRDTLDDVVVRNKNVYVPRKLIKKIFKE